MGGMKTEIELFKSLIQTRQQSQELLQKYNIKQQKGVFIHGQLGTGKTYLAMNIVKAMRHESLTIVNGNEIVDKYQGESERKCQELFAKTETYTNKSNLHILIFDECETLFGKRITIRQLLRSI